MFTMNILSQNTCSADEIKAKGGVASNTNLFDIDHPFLRVTAGYIAQYNKCAVMGWVPQRVLNDL
jgi:hypothetical protein